MDAQRPGTFDKKAFIAAVKAAIEAKSPKTLKEADNYKSSGKAGEVKGEVKGLVTQGKEGQAKDIEAATEAPRRTSPRRLPKPVTPMGPEQPAPGGADPGHGCGAQAGAGRAAQPRGRQAAGQPGDGRRRGHRAAARAVERAGVRTRRWPTRRPRPHMPTPRPGVPASRRPRSSQQGKADAAAETTAKGVNGMQSAKGAALAKLVADKGKAKTKDEAKRAEVTTKIESIFSATEADVKKILDGIDPKVEKEFNAGEAAARSMFENYVAAKMSAYKKDRYGGWLGASALGQGQVDRDARQGQRVLRGRPRALPQADGQGHLPGRRHRRQRPDRGQAADRRRAGTEIATYVEEPRPRI